MLRNPSALDDATIAKIEKLLNAYGAALENILYKQWNPTKELKEIEEVLAALYDAQEGETDDELLQSFDEFAASEGKE